ncbi:type VI secretion system baseplate subunit TssF [Rouxiella sp. T17]|uniref:type VI secretion system baseplate subunit TssF n=1 Tax=Rouxiella sp. T17 TaxID=3085684 RepID=UPI002FCB9A2D
MDDLTLRYFDAEMRYLREAAEEFAEAHPDRAAALSIHRTRPPDPYVERLLEGFAFSMGRLRQKLDDDLPELTEGLVSLIWPQYLRTIPSLSIVEIAPKIAGMKRSEQVPCEYEITSHPVGPKKTLCRYRTTQALTLHPFTLSNVHISSETTGHSVLKLSFSCSELTDWSTVNLKKLRFYLNGDSGLCSALHLALTKKCQSMTLSFTTRHGKTYAPLSLEGYFTPAGFADEDRLWPKGDAAFSGYQLLLEYFTFAEKFNFVDLIGLQSLVIPDGVINFDLAIALREPWDAQLPLSSRNIKLHCVPVINLFRIEADPLTIGGLDGEHLLRPTRLQDGHTEIYSVDSVRGSRRFDEADYVPFTSFRHRGGMQRDSAPERYFHTRVRRGVSGLHDTWLILGGRAWEDDRLTERETLSLQLTATNGQLPRKALQEALIEVGEKSLAVEAKITNLCKPTLPAYPPAEDRFHWRVLSHLGSSFLNMMACVEVLRGTLALYNWLDDEMTHRKLDALLEVKQFQSQRFEKGFLLRGIDIQITLDASGFNGAGDIHLFGEMLNRFFALYTDIHLFNQLTLIIQPSGQRLQWKENPLHRISN